MKLLTYLQGDVQGIGAVRDGRVVPLSHHLGHASMKQLLSDGGISIVRKLAMTNEAEVPLTDVQFLPPVTDPEKIICIGVNYANREGEYNDDAPRPEYPSVFMRTPESLVGHNEALLRPPESDQFDYEGEIAVVIGKEGRRIPESDAESFIAGLTMLNEGSVRDWLRHGKFNVTQGKNFEKSGAVGPWIVTADEIESYDELHLTTHVNGELRQEDTTANLMFPFRYLISYLSTFMRLRPGDLISTGTPLGAGARFDPPRFLQSGDVVQVSCESIGTLSNTVQDEQI